jgi:hypothetical protein
MFFSAAPAESRAAKPCTPLRSTGFRFAPREFSVATKGFSAPESGSSVVNRDLSLCAAFFEAAQLRFSAAMSEPSPLG